MEQRHIRNVILFVLFGLVSLKISWMLELKTIWTIYSVVATLYLISTYALSGRYDPSFFEDLEHYPGVTAVIPCYNDGGTVIPCLETYKNQDYPQDKLQVIIVNDGSTDNSLANMHIMTQRMDNLTIIDHPRNMGKRRAIVNGIRTAKHNIMVTTDCDTVLDRDAIRELVKPFRFDSISGVCGRAEILNPNENIMTKLQVIYYWLGFEVLKSTEAIHNSVMCLSGCLNAYRKDRILPHLGEYEEQKFLGAKPVAGDDRSLTTILLKHGGETTYAPKAVARTMVPDTLIRLIKQQLRWKRSFVREGYLASKFIWRGNFQFALRFYVGTFLSCVAWIAVLHLFISSTSLIMFLASFAGYLLAPVLATIYYWSQSKKFNHQYILFGILWIFLFVWLLPYAVLTVRSKSWVTR